MKGQALCFPRSITIYYKDQIVKDKNDKSEVGKTGFRKYISTLGDDPQSKTFMKRNH